MNILEKHFGPNWTGDVTGGLTILGGLVTAAQSAIANGHVSMVEIGLVYTAVMAGLGLINTKSQNVSNSPSPLKVAAVVPKEKGK